MRPSVPDKKDWKLIPKHFFELKSFPGILETLPGTEKAAFLEFKHFPVCLRKEKYKHKWLSKAGYQVLSKIPRSRLYYWCYRYIRSLRVAAPYFICRGQGAATRRLPHTFPALRSIYLPSLCVIKYVRKYSLTAHLALPENNFLWAINRLSRRFPPKNAILFHTPYTIACVAGVEKGKRGSEMGGGLGR